jgi:hypothetical protein
VGEEEIEIEKKRSRRCIENVSVVREINIKNTRGTTNQNLKIDLRNFLKFFFYLGHLPPSHPHVNPPLSMRYMCGSINCSLHSCGKFLSIYSNK